MKIINSVNSAIISNNGASKLKNPAPAAAQKGGASAKKPVQKIDIPKNFNPEIRLSKKEQAFFEKLYPNSKREIRSYLQQQNKISVEKGKFIDVKG